MLSVNQPSQVSRHMRIVCRQFGDPCQVLRTEMIDTLPIKPRQIRVRLNLAPINPSDLIPVWGHYSHRIALPFVTGYEGTGTVIEVGDNVNLALLGKRVLPLEGEGTWQQTILSPADFAVEIPDWMDDSTAAQLYINPLTAWVICQYQFVIQPGEVLTVNAASSAIGRIFAQLSTILGFRVISVVRSIKHRDSLLEAGAYAVVDSTDNISEQVKRLTNGQGADYAIDLVGADSGTELAFALKPGGRFMALGLFSGQQVDWAGIHRQLNIEAEMFHLRLWNKESNSTRWQLAFNQLIGLIKSGKIMLPQQHDTFALADFKDAIKATQAKGRVNKIMLSGE